MSSWHCQLESTTCLKGVDPILSQLDLETQTKESACLIFFSKPTKPVQLAKLKIKLTWGHNPA